MDVKKWFGIIPDYQCFVDDVIALTEYIRSISAETPIILYGHSMGGNIVINTLLRIPKQEASKYTCAVLESPWLDLYKKPGSVQIALIRAINKVLPNFRIVHRMRSDDLSSVADRAEGYGKDPLYHGYLSARMIVGIMDACQFALANAENLQIDTFLASASDDTVVCNKAIDIFAGKAGSLITSKRYESRHAIHNDANRETYFGDIITFMDSKLPEK